MFAVCSATSCCSSHSQIPVHGGFRPCTPLWKDFQSRCILEEKSVLSLSTRTHLQNVSFKTKAMKSIYSNFISSSNQSLSVDQINGHSCQDKLKDIECNFSNGWSYTVEAVNEAQTASSGKLKYVDSTLTSAEEEVVDFTKQSAGNSNDLIQAIQPETISTVDVTSENPTSVSGSLNIDDDSISSAKSSLVDFLSVVNESFNSSVNEGDSVIKSSLEKVTSSITPITESASEAINNAFGRVFSVVDQTGELTSSKFSSLSSDLKEASGKATTIALDLILGLDPSDPIIPFTLFLGTSTTLWAFYWLWRYGGYSGDLSPKLTLELLSGDKKAILIDIRPEARDFFIAGLKIVKALRERDGIPDLRRASRFRYASVTLPEVGGSVRKLVKGGRDLDDTLVAAVIQNLKTVQDRSRVIVMDADGTTHSKGIARSLRKLGVKRPYMVQGGFQSWVKQGFRIKELKSETTLTMLNEEAEAILEDVNPSPVQLLGYGLGFVAALYALLEWEKTLQLIGIFGLGQVCMLSSACLVVIFDLLQIWILMLIETEANLQDFQNCHVKRLWTILSVE
ncbi:hypothetical protein SLEP1_g38241 [Rubroshorea leprosula]|uniref:Rhodanese domain-containing protein n=1 Tax=Rubroshorea leprosula TaxID=152421 RepID=A0AAV5KY71_9ROSI|nr:hypothetical protein SLEP1_g38241 [Rubroshorea leprosula]